jgi:hypothetical protein
LRGESASIIINIYVYINLYMCREGEREELISGVGLMLGWRERYRVLFGKMDILKMRQEGRIWINGAF